MPTLLSGMGPVHWPVVSIETEPQGIEKGSTSEVTIYNMNQFTYQTLHSIDFEK